MRKHFLILMLMALLPLAGRAENYTVTIGAKAANIQFGVATPTTATSDMFMVLNWGGCDDVDSRNFILAEIASNLSVTSQREAGSSLGNYAFTLSVTAPGYQQIGATEDYYRVVVEDGSSSGTFKQVKNAGKPNLSLGVRAESLTYTGDGEEKSLLSTLPDAYFGADYAGALVTGLPVEFQVKKGGDVVSDWSTNEPKATDAGIYDVKYRVKSDDRYTVDEDVTTLDGIQIAKGTPEITTLPTFAESTTFVGSPVNLITNPGEATLGASMVFRIKIDGGDWSGWYSFENELFTRSAGTFIIEYNTLETENLNAALAQSGSVEIVIDKAVITPEQFTAPTAAALTYNGAEQPLVGGAATTGIDGTFTYATSEDGEDWSAFSADVPTGKNAKSYFVKYKFTPAANYNAYEAVVENVAIAPLSIVDGEGNLAAGFALSAANMEAANASVYTGTAITPTVVLRYNGAAMTHSVLDGGDYARSYNNNINASDEAEIIFTAKNNFTGAYTQKFTINKADIANLNVTLAQTEYTYSAADNEPGVTVKLGDYTFAAEDYAVEYTNNKNAGTATVTVTPNVENFTAASKSVNFTINKAELTVKVADAEKAYGSVDPTPVVESIDGFVGGQTEAVLPEGAYSINRADGADPNTYAYNVVDNDLASCNYSFVNASPQGALTIKAATVIVRATAVNGTYGDYTVPALDQSGFEFTAEGLKAGHTISTLKFTVTDAEEHEYEAGVMLPFGTYTITPSNADTDAGSYTFDYQTATLTIAKRNLTLTAVDQTIEYGESANTEVAFNEPNKTVDVDGRVGGDELGTITINVAAEATSIATHEDAITLSVEGENANYNYTLVPGNLTIDAPVAGITLDGGSASIAQAISDYDGQDVVVKFANMTMNAKEWYAIVLPFATTPAELVKALGQYVVCNVLNTTASTDQNFKFTLEMDELPAGVPFLIKPAQYLDWADFDLGTISSDPVKKRIVSAITDAVAEYESKELVRFTGSYTSQHLQGLKNDNGGEKVWWLANSSIAKPNTDPVEYYDNNWKKPKTNARDTKPMEAYLIGGEGWTTYSPNFTVEDFDGQTTSIKTLGAESIHNMLTEGWYTLNGVKLQSAPTQKGVYINNGKKVVIR